jgi:hypothetical protein
MSSLIWQTHEEYQLFVVNQIKSFPREFVSSYLDRIEMFKLLDLDAVPSVIEELYSKNGRPAKNQCQILRSFILAILEKIPIHEMSQKLKDSPILATIAGFSVDEIPQTPTFYDFINRLLPFEEKPVIRHFVPKSKKKIGKKKLAERRKGIVKKVIKNIEKRPYFPKRNERFLQLIFAKISVARSKEMSLIDNVLNVSGDGTCVKTGASHYGTKICDCKSKGILNCKCARRYCDPNAHWGWDSHEDQWFYGYTGYFLGTYSSMYKKDLPLLALMNDARRHDSVSAIIALNVYQQIYPDMKMTRFLSDSANDTYETYIHLNTLGIEPMIDINKRAIGKNTYGSLEINENGVPICGAGREMKASGIDKTRGRMKWRCPEATKKGGNCQDCPFFDTEKCPTKSTYGRTFYTYLKDNPRLFTSIVRDTKKWYQTYKERSSIERINKQVLLDFGIENSKVRGRKRIYFSIIMAFKAIHLKAQFSITE